MARRSFLAATAASLLSLILRPRRGMAQSPARVDKSRSNLMVVLRETGGANKQEEGLESLGPLRAQLPDGREVDVEFAAFALIGDMHVRFVFDGPQIMVNATAEDLAALKLDPLGALDLAVANIKRVYGAPTAAPWTGGLMEVKGGSPDLQSSYFLDRAFWRDLARVHPDGIVVCVAKRGGLLFTPLTQTAAVDGLRRGVAYLYTSSERLRVSSALYLFKDDRWTVFQPPLGR